MYKLLLTFFTSFIFLTALSCSDDSGTNSTAKSGIVVSGNSAKTTFDPIKFVPYSFGEGTTLLFIVGAEQPDSLMMFTLLEQIPLDQPISLNDESIGIITVFGGGNNGAFNDTTLFINGSITFSEIDTNGVIAAKFSDDATLFGTNVIQTKSFSVNIDGRFKAAKDLSVLGKKTVFNKKTKSQIDTYLLKNKNRQ